MGTRDKDCNCRKPEDCKWDGKCAHKDFVYKGSLKNITEGKMESYIGMSSNLYKDRIKRHFKTFEVEEFKKETTLSGRVWKLKEENKRYEVDFKVIARAKSRAPNQKSCNLCDKEALLILLKESNSLNKQKRFSKYLLTQNQTSLKKTYSCCWKPSLMSMRL